MKKAKVFLSYSRQNEAEKLELEKRLRAVPDFAVWSDKMLSAGAECFAVIREEIKTSDVLLSLVSKDSLASKFCQQELSVAKKAEVQIVSIILEKCDWREVEIFVDTEIFLYSRKSFTALPNGAKPINEWEDADAAWQSVVDGVCDALGIEKPIIVSENVGRGEIINPPNVLTVTGKTIPQIANARFLLAPSPQLTLALENLKRASGTVPQILSEQELKLARSILQASAPSIQAAKASHAARAAVAHPFLADYAKQQDQLRASFSAFKPRILSDSDIQKAMGNVADLRRLIKRNF